MNVGIIVFSHSGHTLSVARKLEERLSVDGHGVTLNRLEIAGPVNLSATTAALKTRPAIAPYNVLVLGSPVNGGRMSAAMNGFLEHIPSLQGKEVVFLLTHFFFPGWGANQTIAQMTEICRSKGATVLGSGSVRWTSLRRRRAISRAIDSLGDLLRVPTNSSVDK